MQTFTAPNHVERAVPETDLLPMKVAMAPALRICNPLSTVVIATGRRQESDVIPADNSQSRVRTIPNAADRIGAILRRFSLFACPDGGTRVSLYLPYVQYNQE